MRKTTYLLAAVAAMTAVSCSTGKKAQYGFGGGWKEVDNSKPAQVHGTADAKTDVAVEAPKTAEFLSETPAETQAARTVQTPNRNNGSNVFRAPSQGSVDASVVVPAVKSSVKKASAKAEKKGGSKSQLVALLLCLLVGTLGIHRFYLGYTGIGIIQLLTLGGLGIWTFIDLIRIILGDLEPKDGPYDETF